MTKAEYVGLTGAEKVYGEKQLLQAQLELLNLTKSFKAYKLLRKEELLLKVGLKSKIGEVLVLIDKFERSLPKTSYKPEEKKAIERKKKISREDMALAVEIAEVRRKLEELKRGM